MEEKKKIGRKAVERDRGRSNSLGMAEKLTKRKRESSKREGRRGKRKRCSREVTRCRNLRRA